MPSVRSIRARHRGRAHADLAVFSFHPVKILTTGEGGMLLTNDDDLHEKLLRLRSHGITRDPRFMEGVSDGPWFYEQVDLGFNYRITDLQAALGTSQLDKLPRFLERRRELARRVRSLCSRRCPSSCRGNIRTHCPPGISMSCGRMRPAPRSTRAALHEGLRKEGIFAQVHYIPVHTQPWYQALGFKPGDFPEAEHYYAGALSLPMFPALDGRRPGPGGRGASALLAA